MAQFKDYYFAPRTAEVLNKYDARMQSKGPNVMDEVGKFLRISMLLNPSGIRSTWPRRGLLKKA